MNQISISHEYYNVYIYIYIERYIYIYIFIYLKHTGIPLMLGGISLIKQWKKTRERTKKSLLVKRLLYSRNTIKNCCRYSACERTTTKTVVWCSLVKTTTSIFDVRSWNMVKTFLFNIQSWMIVRPIFILRILRPRIFESTFRNHCAKKLDGALRKSTSFV